MLGNGEGGCLGTGRGEVGPRGLAVLLLAEDLKRLMQDGVHLLRHKLVLGRRRGHFVCRQNSCVREIERVCVMLYI